MDFIDTYVHIDEICMWLMAQCLCIHIIVLVLNYNIHHEMFFNAYLIGLYIDGFSGFLSCIS